jgi:hypothetical protein
MENTEENRVIHEILSEPINFYAKNLWLNCSPIVCFPDMPLIKVHFIFNMLSNDNIWVCHEGRLLGFIEKM